MSQERGSFGGIKLQEKVVVPSIINNTSKVHCIFQRRNRDAEKRKTNHVVKHG